jgi:MFS family permease
MLDITLIMKNRLFASANVTALLNYTSFFGVSFLISFYLQKVIGLSVLDTGLILLIMPMVMAILSPISGLMSDRIGSKGLSSIGMVLVGIGLLWMSLLTVSSSTWYVSVGLFIIGLGMGIFASPNTSAVMGSVKKSQLGLASGTLATMRFVGQASSLAIMGAIISTIAGTGVISSLFIGIAPTSIISEEFVTGMSYAFVVSALIAFLGAVTSLMRGSFRTNHVDPDDVI